MRLRPIAEVFCSNGKERAVELTLDQGGGPWKPSERYRFDFSRSADDQANALLRAPIRVTNDASDAFA